MKKFNVTFNEEVFEKLNNNQMRSLCGGADMRENNPSSTSSGKRWEIDHIGQNKITKLF